MSTSERKDKARTNQGRPLFDLSIDVSTLSEEQKRSRQAELERLEEIERRELEIDQMLTETGKKVLDSFEVEGFDATASKNYCSGISKEMRFVLALIAFFIGRITQKKLDVRPLLRELRLNNNSQVMVWITQNFAGGRTVKHKADNGKEMELSFSHVASMSLIMESDDVLANQDFKRRTQEFFCNSSLLASGANGVNLWSYESVAYLAVDDETFCSCIAHMYWRMATTKGYLAPLITVSLKIRSFVVEYHGLQSKVKAQDIIQRYERMVVETKTEPKIPFATLQKILEPQSGKRNDDLNVTGAKNTALRQLAAAASEVIKAANKKAKGAKKTKRGEEGAEAEEEE